MTFKLTTTKPLKVGINYPDFRKWDIVRGYGSGEGVVIRISDRQSDYQGWLKTATFTIYPYKRFSKKWKQNIWFKFLKLRVWVGDFYKK